LPRRNSGGKVHLLAIAEDIRELTSRHAAGIED